MSRFDKVGDGVYITKGTSALVTLTGDKESASKPSVEIKKETTTSKWSVWGDDNLFPQNVLTDLEKSSVGLRALEKRKNVHYGRGIIPYVLDETGKQISVIDPNSKKYNKEIADFFKVNQVNLQQIDVINSLEIFANGWLELILNKEQTKINRMFAKDPAYCRWEVMNQTNGRIENMYYYASWDINTNPSESDLQIIPTYDPGKYDGNKYSGKKFIYPLFYKSFNKSYYHLAIWNSVRENSWMQIANKVPTMKLAIMKNQMTIKYHIEIPSDYFVSRYPSPKYNDEYREKRLSEKINELDEFLSNIENSGKALVTLSYYDKMTKASFPGWKINVIENKLKDDAYLPDSQAANSEILFAIGVDPSLIGGSGVPGGKLGAGSGSDKREAFWMLNAEMGTYRTISLSWLYFVKEFNKWPDEVNFDYMVVDTSQTQDQHPTKINQNVDTTSNK
jgi:hypothetical protein